MQTTMLPIPPQDIRVWVGPFADAAAFIIRGARLVNDISKLCRLKLTDRVLEVGCGCGRLARALRAV
jgi:protein-L-isoaspartate O-methyltransferase